MEFGSHDYKNQNTDHSSVSATQLPRERGQTSLGIQGLRACLPMQGTWIQSLIQEEPTCHGATKPMRHNYWARDPQQEKPRQWEVCTQQLESSPQLPATRDSPCAATKTQHGQK